MKFCTRIINKKRGVGGGGIRKCNNSTFPIYLPLNAIWKALHGFNNTILSPSWKIDKLILVNNITTQQWMKVKYNSHHEATRIEHHHSITKLKTRHQKIFEKQRCFYAIIVQRRPGSHTYAFSDFECQNVDFSLKRKVSSKNQLNIINHPKCFVLFVAFKKAFFYFCFYHWVHTWYCWVTWVQKRK